MLDSQRVMDGDIERRKNLIGFLSKKHLTGLWGFNHIGLRMHEIGVIQSVFP